MEKLGEGLLDMAKTRPGLYIFTMLAVLTALVILGIIVIKVSKSVGDWLEKAKQAKLKKAKIGKFELEAGDSSSSAIENAEEVTPQIYDNLSNLANLIIDFPEAARKYENRIYEIKHQLTDDQYKDFSNEIKKYRVNLKKYYCEKLKLTETDDKARLFGYWLRQVTNDDVSPQINSILFRNGLNEKTAEQLEDMLRKLYEETFALICDSVDEAPPYIKMAELKEIIVSTKNEYRSALETGLNNARKRRVEKESTFERARQEYTDERLEILYRDLPKDVVEKIRENVK